MKKLWFCGFVVLFLIIAPVTAVTCNPVPNTGFCTVSGTTKYTYNGIPFSFTIFNNGAPDNLLAAAPGVTITRPMNGYTATKIHFLENAGSALQSPNGYNAGKIVVFYQDGTSDSLDLIIGVNIAEMHYDRPGVQSALAHKKITPAYSYPYTYYSSNYNTHFFYTSINTASKPIDRIELQNTATVVGVGIDAITLESSQNQSTVLTVEVTPLSTISTAVTISKTGQAPISNSGDSGFYLAVIIVLIMILCVGGVYGLHIIIRKKNSGDVTHPEQKTLSGSTSFNTTTDNATKFRPSSFKNESAHHDIFVSYSHEDKAVADAICATLESHNIRCWIAPRDVLPGEDYPAAIINAIEQCRIMVLVYSSKSNNSDHVMRELTKAVSSAAIIIPFRIEDIPLSKNMEYLIGIPHWLDALTPPLEQHIDKLVQTVKVLLTKVKTK